ncbi:LOW QUALITY PROTEIN: tyrosyl-DNA phosphodiesterase 1-like [Lytechinus variegatus]|uniref:LOW QUALITY PROTEIN: tyrosyl-DNA phosphodiesterase 1-like n=1 Tax=Lytechinus variegatus TaxID=7654 RepID=UPI001BB0DC49|nr:LOW QUALITY PROTEIN: tyrosyl-DNA phosphodiesterase 1-like [Lytechinus variegatus]
MANLADDEDLALKLQQQYDMEEEREHQDLMMARALAAGHDISDSDDDRPSTNKKSSFLSEHTVSDSDSDATYIEDEDVLNTNDNHPTTRQAKRKLESDSDSGPQNEDEDRRGKKKTGVKTKSQEKKSLISQSTKRLKKEDTVIIEEGETSMPRGSKEECHYGSKCYRKNPSHLEEYTHQGKKSPGKPSPKRQKSEGKKYPLSCPEAIKESSPYGFLLTKVEGIASTYNNQYAVHIKDILDPCMGKLVESAQFNYMFDIPWLMKQYPREFRDKPLLIVHGEQREGKIALHEAAHPFPNIKLCQARLDIMYGTHHSKMMFLLYANGMRVVIHTANIIEMDWHQKTQGVWISPLFPKLPSAKQTASDGESPTFFKRDLLAYLTAYRAPSLQPWKDHITQHDLSGAKVFLIASVPGRHIGESKDKWGHLKVRKILRQYGPDKHLVQAWPVIGQFSSIGSLGADKTKWLCAEFLQSMSSVKGQSGTFTSNADTRHMKLIYPCSDNVRTSLEGYPAGGSLPYSIQTAKKQPYLHQFFFQWKASRMGRSRASPHIKSYSRLSPDNKEIAWFMVTSANLSKAAWGVFEKNGSQLMIRSYEIGVMMIPCSFDKTWKTFPLVDGHGQKEFSLPWDVPLTPYSKSDRPWIWDIPYTDKPDSHGNAWVPGRR